MVERIRPGRPHPQSAITVEAHLNHFDAWGYKGRRGHLINAHGISRAWLESSRDDPEFGEIHEEEHRLPGLPWSRPDSTHTSLNEETPVPTALAVRLQAAIDKLDDVIHPPIGRPLHVGSKIARQDIRDVLEELYSIRRELESQ